MSFREAGDGIVDAVKRGLYQTGLEIMRESQVLVPVDTSVLKQSARIEEPVQVGTSVVLEMGYGYGVMVNPITGHIASQYAVPVHERLDQKHKPPTQSKFLEQPVLSHANNLGENITAEIARYVRDPNTAKLERYDEKIL